MEIYTGKYEAYNENKESKDMLIYAAKFLVELAHFEGRVCQCPLLTWISAVLKAIIMKLQATEGQIQGERVGELK